MIIDGVGSQTGSPGAYRWGDYSMMSVDPKDDCTFWYTTEYGNSSGSWSTRIGADAGSPVIAGAHVVTTGSGTLYVLRLADGYVGFQNGIYWDADRAHTRSASAWYFIQSR